MDENDARLLHFWLVQNGYIDHLDHIQPSWHEARDAGTLAAMPNGLASDADRYVGLINTVFDKSSLRGFISNGRKTVMPQIRRKNLERREDF